MRARAAKFRTNHVGTKLNEAELKDFGALAEKRQQSPSELIRGLVLREIELDKQDLQGSSELVEIIYLRLLVLNLLRPAVTGKTITDEKFNEIVAYAKKNKRSLAKESIEALKAETKRTATKA